MSKAKRFFNICLVFFLILGGALLSRFVFQYHQFASKNRFVKAENINYYLLQTPLKRVRVGADFTYQYQGSTYTSQHTFGRTAFLNEYGAREWIEGKKLIPPYVYLNPKAPQRATLERIFPWKSGLQFVLALVAMAYFAYLKNYVRRYV